MFCPNCGKDCGGGNFCSHCGRVLRQDTPPQSFVEKKAELQASGQVYCPKCLSTSVSVQDYKNQFVYSNTIAGAIMWRIREKQNARNRKVHGIQCTCLKCNYIWYTQRLALREQHVKCIWQHWKERRECQLSPETYIRLDDIGITVGHYNKMEYMIPYEEIVAVEIRKCLGPLNGRLSIRYWENKRKRFLKTFEEARKDDFTVFFVEGWTEDMFRLYGVLKEIVTGNKKAGMF